MEPDALAPNLSYTEFVYNNESDVTPLYWPLAISQLATKRNAYELYTDNPDQYITYSGDWQSLLVSREKEGRYRSFTLRAYSGDSFKFYISTPSGVADSRYYSGPLTVSGVYNTLQEYASENDARTNAITFTAPSGNSYVYSLPQVLPIDWVRLHHQAIASGESYRLYQFLPRTLIQVDDLEADVIDAVTVRVSDSIVVTADDLADGSITGAKILAGTVSGVLITPGTITSNLIQAQAITADKLDVSQLDALATNTGSLFVNSGITLGENGFLWTGQSVSGEVFITKSGIIVDNAFAPGTEVFSVGGGSRFIFNYVPRSRIRYFPSLYSVTTPIDYTLTPYSGPEFYFDVSASQLGKISNTSDAFNGYASRIQTGYSPTPTGLRNDYAESTISVVASGQSYFTLFASDSKEAVGSSITMTAGGNAVSYLGGNPGTRVSINSRELRVSTSFANIRDNLTVYKDVSQTGPFIEAFSPILEVNETNFRYVDPKDSFMSSPAVDLFVVNNSGNASLKGNLTVSGSISTLGAVYGTSGLNTQYEMSSAGIFFRDSADNSLIFKANTTGITLNSSTGGRIIDISTSTGNLDMFGGDFFMYNSAETDIVASITKTGVAEFTGSTKSPNFYASTGGSVSAPAFTFSTDLDSGLFSVSDGVLALTTNAVESTRFTAGQIRAANGTQLAPSISFANDPDTGIYRLSGGIGFSMNDSIAAYITTNNVLAVNTTNQNGQITAQVPDGTARNVLTLIQNNSASPFVNFSSAIGVGEPIQTSALGTYYGKIRVQANGTIRWIALYNT